MGRTLKRVSPKGFTLVELLIVVAIIGVLSSIGVPTFRRMVTKSKQSEAKVALGGLFTAESAFFTEYNTYGSRVRRVGFQLEGARRLYTIGFPDATCKDGLGVQPDDTNVKGNLTQLYPAYYQPNNDDKDQENFYPRGTSTNVLDANKQQVAQSVCALAAVDEIANTYLATATGNIAPGVQPTGIVTGGSSGSQDVWTIDQARNLVNANDGTN